MSNPRCPLCGEATTELVLLAPDFRMGQERPHAVWRCARCDVGITASAWDAQARADAYARGYAPHDARVRAATGLRGRMAASIRQGFGYAQELAWPLPWWLMRALARVRAWTWQPPPPPAGRLLDVGCGSGVYGASLIRLGWQVDGVEPDAHAAELARAHGLNVQANSIEQAVLPRAAYDVVTLWHSLEHTSNPVAVLRKLHAALRPQGLLMVEVPNMAGWGAGFMGPYWYHWDLPRHRLHFTPSSLRRAMERAGYEDVRVQYVPNPHGLAGGLRYRFGWRSAFWLAAGWFFGLSAALFHRADVIRAQGRRAF